MSWAIRLQVDSTKYKCKRPQEHIQDAFTQIACQGGLAHIGPHIFYSVNIKQRFIGYHIGALFINQMSTLSCKLCKSVIL